MDHLINVVLLGFLGMTAVAIIVLRDLFAVVMLSGIYSLLSAALFVSLEAVDVAFTEAAVGAGISTVLMIVTLAMVGRVERPTRRGTLLPLMVVTLTGAALVYGTLDLPPFGDPSAPIHVHVAPRYLDQAASEVGVPNRVTAVLASYRAYDTLGETAVVFTAGIGVLAMLGSLAGWPGRSRSLGRDRDLVLRVVARVLLPFVLLFALYVQFHGDYGPGGGFQAGVIFAAGFILYGLLSGLARAYRVLSPRALQALMAFGVLLYGGVGLLGPLLGAGFLDYSVLGSTPLGGQHLGIALVEAGVGVTVFATMVSLFQSFVGQVDQVGQVGKSDGGER